MGSASAFSIIHSCDLPGHQFYRALPCGLIINMMLCYDISLWQVMSMMDGTERLKENHTHTHTQQHFCQFAGNNYMMEDCKS